MALKKITKPQEKNPQAKYPAHVLQKINERAYYIWIHKGRPTGNGADNWFEAEKELKKEGAI
ncbi:MAG: DUF2934 domain-containing protein [Candidatus Omnitrophota bacterium]